MKIELSTNRFHHTQKQMDVIQESVDIAVKQYSVLIEQARKLDDAIEQLGHSTFGADGDTVRHGANMDCHNVRDYFINAAQNLKVYIVDRDYWDLINYKNNFISGRFLTDEEMTSKYQHCLDLIPVLEKKLEKFDI